MHVRCLERKRVCALPSPAPYRSCHHSIDHLHQFIHNLVVSSRIRREAPGKRRRSRFAPQEQAPEAPAETPAAGAEGAQAGPAGDGNPSEAPTPQAAGDSTPGAGGAEAEGGKKKKRRRWGEATNPINMPTILGSGAMPNLPHVSLPGVGRICLIMPPPSVQHSFPF